MKETLVVDVMALIKFMVQVPMDCWRQWIRHRTANVNEYSTRYTEALDMCQTTAPDQWRLQATDNKQGSAGITLYGWPKNFKTEFIPDSKYESGFLFVVYSPDGQRIVSSPTVVEPTEYLCNLETDHHEASKWMYDLRIQLGIAKEQARKDLPLSTYTRAYWKCDLHNIFNFLRLRMDSHAQYEIRMYANAMYEIVKQIVPVACEAFEDYVLNACKFSAMEMRVIKQMVQHVEFEDWNDINLQGMSNREVAEFKKKVGV
jgi:thymidylate synthase (FAD)